MGVVTRWGLGHWSGLTVSAALVLFAVGAGEVAMAATAGATTDPSTASLSALPLDSCATTVTGPAGARVAMRQSAISGPVTAAIGAEPGGRSAADRVRSALGAMAPLSLGDIPHGRRVITGTELAGLVAAELQPVPGLGLTPGRLAADVHTALDHRCGLTVTDSASVPGPTGTTTPSPTPSSTTTTMSTTTSPNPAPRPRQSPPPTSTSPSPTPKPRPSRPPITTSAPFLLTGTPSPATPPTTSRAPKPPVPLLTGSAAPPAPAPGTPPVFGPPSPSASPSLSPLSVRTLDIVRPQVIPLDGVSALPSPAAMPVTGTVLLPPVLSPEPEPAPRPEVAPNSNPTAGDQNEVAGPVTSLPTGSTGLGGWTAFAVIWMTGVATLRVRSWARKHGTGR